MLTYDYTWSSDGKLTSLSWTSSWGDPPGSMLFYYDAEGRPAFVDYVDEYGYATGRYEYVLNLQGDVVALYCPTKKTNVVTYTYDAWGKQIGFTAFDSGYAGLVYKNPLCYRGYCYDEETGFYYLQSRYYDPSVGRFLNADHAIMLQIDISSIIKRDLFTYCSNNSVMYSDPTGYGLFPVGGSNYFYKNYKTSVSKWAAKYAPMSNGVEYGAIIYRIRVLFWTWFFMGETYEGFQTTNWYTVINGLGVGFLTSIGKRAATNLFWPVASLSIVGFAHTHPMGHTNKPSGPDVWMKRLGWIVSLRIFPIAIYNNNQVSINYF